MPTLYDMKLVMAYLEKAPKLNGTNYAAWKFDVEMALTQGGYGLWEVVSRQWPHPGSVGYLSAHPGTMSERGGRTTHTSTQLKTLLTSPLKSGMRQQPKVLLLSPLPYPKSKRSTSTTLDLPPSLGSDSPNSMNGVHAPHGSPSSVSSTMQNLITHGPSKTLLTLLSPPHTPSALLGST
ncbi:hypothetical protein BS47DRAFT_1362552 [Hydnum rufescens UP504]|uniref:Uncharacterized protein n=1 Tax=Hydnum rufescens UP504 TaxID=1448309 RepID=A0A9P6DWW8_9AGAM|nr:hypothetical protein BS47DRAFT_1362552 [Hydnum rufescens UP504]